MTRVITAVALIIAASYLVFYSPFPVFLIAAAFLGAGGYWEFAGLVKGHGIERPGIFGLLAGLLIIFLPQQTLLGLSILAVGALAIALREDDLRKVLPQVSCAIFGGVYAFAPWRFAANLRSESVHWLFFVLTLNWVGDSAAFYVGRAFGRHKLAPLVSPGKTWEGAAGSIVGSMLVGVAYMHTFVPQASWGTIAFLAAAGNIAGQMGDLAESAMKRGAGVKDSGRLLPGHGGLLDRVDSNLFALPVVYALHTLLSSTRLFV